MNAATRKDSVAGGASRRGPGAPPSIAGAALQALQAHWPEYLIEGALLGSFMISAGLFTILLEHPDSPVVSSIADPFLRRALVGVAMGVTALGLILSPIGKRSGAHFNPAVTLAFLRLGKIRPWDGFFYVVAHFAGGVAGVALVVAAFPAAMAHPSVRFVATLPGSTGPWIAFAAEFGISFLLMAAVLISSNTPRAARWTPSFAAFLVAVFIIFEAPLSGMSLNPARSFASAFPGGIWTGLWIYFTAPVLAMQAAALT